ncbi:hypothetical protein [Altericista sp. CCNU0014]|uniref:hypothetical protein n=1 Tax=Altericista sp. CCNU0014 TaxID=3082949 RepID=UPI00384AB690
MAILLSLTTIACGGPTPDRTAQGGRELPQSASNTANRQGATKIADGKYDVQQATYNDGNGEYTLFLLNTPPGTSATFRTDKLQMAQLTPEEVSASQEPYLQVKDGQAALHIPKDFKLEYVHNVVEQAQNPQTGEVEQRVVRQESNFWSPFAGALAGQVVGNLLFRPQYYVPPLYQPGGGGLSGFGGYGSSYGQATSAYRQRYNQAPAVERNRTAYRTTQQRRTTGFGSSSGPRRSVSGSSNQRSTGRGFGSSNLERSRPSTSYRRPSSGFGSSRSFGSGRSFSGGRRR